MKTNQKFYLLIGQSGCGKDTQAQNIKNAYTKALIAASTGDGVRGVVALGEEKPELYFPKRMKEINDKSQRQPAEIALYFLVDFLKWNSTTKEENILINGSPRSEDEVHGIARLIRAGYLPKATIIWIEISDETAYKRLKDDATRKGRTDSNSEEAIREKLAWYPDVVAAKELAITEHSDVFDIVVIDGEPSKEEVWEQINSKIFEEQKV